MIDANNYDSSKDLLEAIKLHRLSQISQYNPNPSVHVKLLHTFPKEYYEAFISYNWMDKNWCVSVTYHGLSNQGKRYLTYKGARRFSKLETIASMLHTWMNAGTSRIELSTSRWNQIKQVA